MANGFSSLFSQFAGQRPTGLPSLILGAIGEGQRQSAFEEFQRGTFEAIQQGVPPAQALLKPLEQNPGLLGRIQPDDINKLVTLIGQGAGPQPQLFQSGAGIAAAVPDPSKPSQFRLEQVGQIAPGPLFEVREGQVIFADPTQRDANGNPIVNSTPLEPNASVFQVDTGGAVRLVKQMPGAAPQTLATYAKTPTPGSTQSAVPGVAEVRATIVALAAGAQPSAMDPALVAAAKRFGVTDQATAKAWLDTNQKSSTNIFDLLTGGQGGPAAGGLQSQFPELFPTPQTPAPATPAPALAPTQVQPIPEAALILPTDTNGRISLLEQIASGGRPRQVRLSSGEVVTVTPEEARQNANELKAAASKKAQ